MAEKLDPRQVATFEEVLRTCLYEQEALRRVLVLQGCGIPVKMPYQPFDPVWDAEMECEMYGNCE